MDETNSGSSTGGPSLTQLLGGLGSLAGAGLSLGNMSQNYGVLQNALNTIGPTQLQGQTLSGPGGMSSGFNSNANGGGGAINLGSLQGAFSNFGNAATVGSANYNPAMLQGLTNTSNGTLSPALSNLLQGYSGNQNYQNLAAGQAGTLGQTYNQIYGNTLSSLQAQQQPQVQQQAFGLQNTLFGNGTLGSTGATSGALAAGNFGSQVNAMNAQDALSAQQQALSGMQGQSQIASQLSGTGNNLLSNAFSNFGNTNQLISGLNTAQLNNAGTATQGAGALNTMGLNNYNSALQTGMGAATATNQSLFPYASVAQALAGQPNAQSGLASLLSGAGGSLLGSGGLSGLLNGLTGSSQAGGASGIAGLLGNLFGGSSNSGGQLGSIDPSLSMTSTPYSSNGYASGDLNQLFGPLTGQPSPSGSGTDTSVSTDTGNTDWLSQLYGSGFNGAGGQAATAASGLLGGLSTPDSSIPTLGAGASNGSPGVLGSSASPSNVIGGLGSLLGLANSGYGLSKLFSGGTQMAAGGNPNAVGGPMTAAQAQGTGAMTNPISNAGYVNQFQQQGGNVNNASWQGPQPVNGDTSFSGSIPSLSGLLSGAGTGMGAISTIANLGMGNYTGAAMGALGLGSKAGLIPSYVSQPLGLLGSIATMNPVGIASNLFGVGKGLYNLAQGNPYTGANPPQPTGNLSQQASDDLGAAASADVNNALNQAISDTAPKDDTSSSASSNTPNANAWGALMEGGSDPTQNYAFGYSGGGPIVATPGSSGGSSTMSPAMMAQVNKALAQMYGS